MTEGPYQRLARTLVQGCTVSTIRRHNGEYETIVFDGPSTEEGNPVYPWPDADAAHDGHDAVVNALRVDPLRAPTFSPTQGGEDG